MAGRFSAKAGMVAVNGRPDISITSRARTILRHGDLRLLSVNVGQPRPNPWKTMKLTGIDKRPMEGAR